MSQKGKRGRERSVGQQNVISISANQKGITGRGETVRSNPIGRVERKIKGSRLHWI